MADPTLTQTTLALFTTAEKAEEIEGDLIEQAATRGRWWYLLQVKLTAAALFFHGLFREPGKHLLLGYAVYELMLKVNWWLLRPIRLFLNFELGWVEWQWQINGVLNACTAFAVGMLLVRLFPRAGAQIAFIATALMLARVSILQSAQYAAEIAVFALLPLTLGLLAMKWLELRRRGRMLVAR